MKVTITKDSTCGNVPVPSGEYMVTLAADTSQLALIGGGKTHKIPAVRRRSAGRSRTTTVSLIPGGAGTYSIVMSTPKQGEWVAMMEVANSSKKDDKR